MTDRLSGENLGRYQNLKGSEEAREYVAKHSAANTLFATKPMDFFRRHAVLPPSKLGGQTLDSQGAVWTDSSEKGKNVVTGGSRGRVAEVIWKTVDSSQRIVRVDFEPCTTGNEAGSMTFKIGKTGVPIYFLPWESLSVVSLTIPDAGGAFYEPDDPDNPGLFFTAAINGCSVFMRGSPHSPEIFHAGIDGSFASTTDAVDFWQGRMGDILAKQGAGDGALAKVRQVNKRHYIKDPLNSDPTTTATATAFEAWLTSNQKDEFRVQIVSPWACVFGIRFGRAWSFYLQENATATILRYVKKSDVHEVRVNENRTQLQMKGSGEVVTKEVQKKKVLGPITRSEEIYMARQVVSKPLQIREFFPRGGGVIRVKDEVRRI